MHINQLSNSGWSLVRTADYSTNGYPTRTPTTTKPSGTGVIPFGDGGSECPGHVLLLPFGTGASTNTFSMKVLGWHGTFFSTINPEVNLWVPVVLATYQATLGTATGVANSDIDSSHFFATTITISGAGVGVTSGMAATSLDWFVVSPGSNDIGVIVQPSFGFKLLEVIFTTGGSATACNALYCKF